MTNPSLQSRRIPNFKHYCTINLFVVWFCVVSDYFKTTSSIKKSVKEMITKNLNWATELTGAVDPVASVAFWEKKLLLQSK